MILFCSIKMLLIVAFEIPITELKFLNVSLLKAFWYIQTCKSSKVNKRMFVKDFTLESNATKRHPVRTLSSSVFWEIHTPLSSRKKICTSLLSVSRAQGEISTSIIKDKIKVLTNKSFHNLWLDLMLS